MPPQAAVLAGALAWNFQRSRCGKTTISQFARRHKVASMVGLAALNAYLIPHWFLD